MSADHSASVHGSAPGITGDHRRKPVDRAARDWLRGAVAAIEADFHRSSDTHLHRLDVEGLPGVQIYLKDEATHPTGSLKHRLARSLILYGLCNGRIGRGTTLIEASSGSTAVSESYFARLLGLPFVAVVPRGTSRRKLDEIVRHGGRCVEVAPGEIYAAALKLEAETGGYYLDQFTNAERATDWRSNNNIAETLFEQLEKEPHPAPAWVVVGAGTGGTSATIGRFLRYRADSYAQTQVCVADPENSVFFDGYAGGSLPACGKSRIEGVGRPRMEPSFLPDIVDRMVKVSDAASIATIWWLKDRTGKRYGPSTGLNVYAALMLGREMVAAGQEGSIATLICDGGERYEDTCYSDAWLAEQGVAIAPELVWLQGFGR